MVTRILGLCSAIALVGCFDVREFDPGTETTPVVIDDFEDGDAIPSLAPLGRWYCASFNPDHDQMVGCDVTEPGRGYQSTLGLFIDFNLQDPPDAAIQDSGAVLLTTTQNRPLDLSAYRRIIVSATLESGSPPLPQGAAGSSVLVEFGCVSAEGETGPLSADGGIAQQIRPDENWQTFSLELATFVQPTWQSPRIVGGTPACLQKVDTVRLSTTPKLMDGQRGGGRLTVDDLRLE